MYKNVDRRRNLLEIVADLGFAERKPQELVSEQRIVEPPAPVATVPVAEPARDPGDAMQGLSEAQRRAAEQRAAAERALREALELEQRLAEEAEQMRLAAIANARQARLRELNEALERVTAAERAAIEEAEACTKRLARLGGEKQQAEALKADDEAAAQAASTELAAAEARLAEARRKLEMAQAACSESARRFADISTAEEAARAKGAAAEETAATQRTERETLEAELRALEAQGGLPKEVASITDAAKRVAERRAADAAKRLAERRAADVLRASTAS
jgi:DNA repair exonuclease SbcCD ATPase subunit